MILADDLGFSDLACFGGEIDTPHLDRLAAAGVRMSSFYVTPRCSPSRAALLTGRHPHSVGIGILTTDDRPNGYAGSLSPEVPTIAGLLKERGYRTALAGKWHLSSDTTTPNETWPTNRGFDEFYGILPGCASYYRPPLVEHEQRLPDGVTAGDYYLTDDISRFAVDVVERASDRGEPFFLYLSYTAPHWPLHAREADIARFRERYRAGWDELRGRRFDRLERMGLTSIGALPPRDPEVPAWEESLEHEWELERMATYAAQVAAMDRGIGALLDTLDSRGIRDDTLIVFTSDNGACEESLPFAGRRMNEDVCPTATRDGREVRIGNDPAIMPGPEEGYASYGRAWAHLSNTPFRLYKRWVHEGGISSACIASWPNGGIARGQTTHVPGHVVDLVPSILAALGDVADGPGESLLDHWREPATSADAQQRRDLFWEHMGSAAVRRGRWKLVREGLQPWELYDLDADRGETTDLIAREPELAADLQRAWASWAETNGVIPWEGYLARVRR
jgi:arylsulfatase